MTDPERLLPTALRMRGDRAEVEDRLHDIVGGVDVVHIPPHTARRTPQAWAVAAIVFGVVLGGAVVLAVSRMGTDGGSSTVPASVSVTGNWPVAPDLEWPTYAGFAAPYPDEPLSSAVIAERQDDGGFEIATVWSRSATSTPAYPFVSESEPEPVIVGGRPGLRYVDQDRAWYAFDDDDVVLQVTDASFLDELIPALTGVRDAGGWPSLDLERLPDGLEVLDGPVRWPGDPYPRIETNEADLGVDIWRAPALHVAPARTASEVDVGDRRGVLVRFDRGATITWPAPGGGWAVVQTRGIDDDAAVALALDTANRVSWTSRADYEATVDPAGPNPAPTSTTVAVSPTTSTTVGPRGDPCGAELPVEIVLPDDFDGPVEGPSPLGATTPETGQLVVHWTGRGGAVEARWPPEVRHTEGAPFGEVGDWSTGPFVILGRAIGSASPTSVEGYEGIPTHIASGPCDVVQLDVVEGDGSTDGQEWGFEDLDPIAGRPAIGVYPSLLRPRDVELVIGELDVERAPEVTACDGGADFPNRQGPSTGLPIADTPEEALRSLLAEPDATTWPKAGYLELRLPDGTIVYANPVDDLSADPGLELGVVIAVTVAPVDGGWAVERWETSGC